MGGQFLKPLISRRRIALCQTWKRGTVVNMGWDILWGSHTDDRRRIWKKTHKMMICSLVHFFPFLRVQIWGEGSGIFTGFVNKINGWQAWSKNQQIFWQILNSSSFLFQSQGLIKMDVLSCVAKKLPSNWDLCVSVLILCKFYAQYVTRLITYAIWISIPKHYRILR